MSDPAVRALSPRCGRVVTVGTPAPASPAQSVRRLANMVNLTRIYTRTGDDGTTSLGDFSRTSKNDPRLVAYADVDELNCQLGVVLATASDGLDPRIVALLTRIQNELFDVGADLCTPLTPEPPKHEPLRVTEDYVDRLESACDEWNADLPKLRSFILPGGTPAAAHLNVARTVARRAERATWAAADAHGSTPDGGINLLTARYLNRLSDLLFILGRVANPGGDILWVPGGER